MGQVGQVSQVGCKSPQGTKCRSVVTFENNLGLIEPTEARFAM